MDGDAILSELDTQASAVFKGRWQEHIYLHVKRATGRGRTDGGLTSWDVDGTTPL